MSYGKEPAFARPSSSVTGNSEEQKGLTKRKYYVGLVMQGMLACGYGDFNDKHFERIADLSIKQADELLKQLETK